MAEPITVLITGAAGQIGYALAPQIARGAMFGPEQKVILHLLDIPPAQTALEGVVMELIDCAYPLLSGVVYTTDPDVACKGVQFACLIGGFPRGPGMERKEVMGKNVSIYKGVASSLVAHAAKDVKIVVVANPANTNSLILSENAPSIPKENISCLTRLDHNRALGQISYRLGVPVTTVKNVVIWGNHSSTQYPDVNHATVDGVPVRDAVKDNDWLDGDFMKIVQQRGAAIIKARKLSSALSAASSVCDHVRNWVFGTKDGEWVSMGVVSDGSYSIPAGLMYSFPVTCKDGKWTIVPGLSIDDNSRKLMDITANELVEEKAMALECLKEQGL
uniref:Malate dehydrogenase n=1 Tax=Pyramimonas obovata TaxID=1411642 RepID=A0A7S0RXG8_9CHLO|eukprot:CAMPEP_0118921820 /NCGR_PEP_ID=MMETSP1169-20130426/971_1 /TAXON_ID=36882 /ORGANISM="Pyramimonas obovata, Strain CCMP722" /LENGTH=331 /DNA_ID=CAMNT_0006862611 /DNA_START=82 /DNA_END=1077 /DNA_ORIENTATION=+